MPYLQDTSTAFNPGIAKTNDPDYLKLSKAIEQPAANTSVGEALKGTGDVFGASVKVAHTLTEEGIKDEEYRRLNEKREKFTTDIDNVYNSLVPTKVTDASLNILSSSPADAKTPQSVGMGVDRLTEIEAARPGGKYSQEHLDAEYDKVLKDLRSRYPGWREFIDEQSHKITGRDVANDYIKQKIADVNAWAAKSASEKDKLVSKGLQHLEITDMPLHLQLFQDGRISSFEFTTFMNNSLNFKYKREQQQAELENLKGSKEIMGLKAEGIAQGDAAQAFTNGLNTLFAGQEKDPNKLIEGLTKNIDGPKALQLAQAWEQSRIKVEAELRAKWNIPDATGQTMFMRLGEKKANELIAEHSQLHKDVIGYLKDQQVGPLVMAKKLGEMYQDQDTLRVMESNLGRSLGFVHTIEQKVGPTAFPLLLPNLLSSGLGTQLDAFVTEKKLMATAGAVNPDTGEKRSLPKDIVELQKRFPETQVRAVAADRFVKQYELLRKPVPDDVKRTAIDYIYNQGLIALIAQDTDRKAGKNSLYSELLSDDLLKEGKRLGGATWEKQSNWAKDTFGNELLKPALLSMKDINIPSRLDLQWDNEKHNFRVVDEKGKDVLYRSTAIVQSVGAQLNPFAQRTLININQNLGRLSSIAKIDGSDVNEFLVKEMLQLGLDPTSTKMSNIPEHMISAIVASKKKAEESAAETAAARKKLGL